MLGPRTWCFAGAVWLGGSGIAQAEPLPSERAFSASLEYVAPASCPRADDFKGVVARRLGFDPFDDDAANRVIVLIAVGEQTLEGRVEWRDANGRWAGDQSFPVRHGDCAELARTMGFALAVQIHLLAAGSEPDEASKPATTDGDGGDRIDRPTPGEDQVSAPAQASPQPSPPVAPVRDVPDPAVSKDVKAPSAARWTFAAGAGGALGIGLASSLTPLGRLFGGISWGSMTFELAGELGMPTSTERPDGAGFSQRAILATAAGCGTRGPWSVCVLAKGGLLAVEGENIDVPQSSTPAAFQAGLRLGVRERIGKDAFLAQRLEALANVTRWTVRLDRVPVWTAPVFAGTLGIDAGLLFE
jgi:hypothetical protein